MPITTAVTRKMDNNYVQVEVSGKKTDTRYYRVPENMADSFQKEYIANGKKAAWLSNGLMILGIAVMTVASYFLTKKSNDSSLKTLVGLIAGVAGGFTGTFAAAKAEMKSHERLLYKYNASEINYSQKSLVK